MQFVFLGSELCLQLPSDSTSRWTPLLLANGWQLPAPIADFHRLATRHAWRTNKTVFRVAADPENGSPFADCETELLILGIGGQMASSSRCFVQLWRRGFHPLPPCSMIVKETFSKWESSMSRHIACSILARKLPCVTTSQASPGWRSTCSRRKSN